MKDFPTIDEAHEILNDIVDRLPLEFLDGLNQGIVLLPEYKLHPESKQKDQLYVMGEYVKSIIGRRIVIYYGSFEKVFKYLNNTELEEKLKETFLHELTHHLESLAGERGLEVKDAEFMEKYRNK